MFLKPFKIRTHAIIKGSDGKKLRKELCTQYPDVAEDVFKELIPNKDVSLMKITTHAEEPQAVYCVNDIPMFFGHELDRVFYPTVYALWKHPSLLSTVIATWPPVFEKMVRGADLMLPGVITAQPLGKFPKHHPCAVKLAGNKSAVCVGMTHLSSEDMYLSAMKGKGVIILHHCRDYLWEKGDKSEPPMIADIELQEALSRRAYQDNDESTEEEAEDTNAQDTPLAEDLQQLAVNDEEKGNEDSTQTEGTVVDSENSNTERVEGGAAAALDEEEGGEEEEVEEEEEDQMTPAAMDALLESCLLIAIKEKVKKPDLPVLTSKFYKDFMQPVSPQDKPLDVRKSSYKKLGKFMAAMKQKGYISIKEQPKGVEKITEVQKSHPQIRAFTVPAYVSELDSNPPSQAQAAGGDSSSSLPQITEMYTLTSAAMPIFSTGGYKKGDALTVAQVKKVITDYVNTNNLKHQTQGYVILDPLLSDLVGGYEDTLRWEEVFSRCHNKLSPAYKLSVQGKPDIIKKGKLEPVNLKVATRSGNKKVTLVTNLETYCIDVEDFAHRIQKGVACSTSISDSPHGKAKAKEVLVQGNQINFIEQLLTEKYGLPSRCIAGLEKAPKKKKK